MVILYNNIPAKEVGVEFLQTKAYQDTPSWCQLRDLLAKAIGQPLCMRVAPSPYSLASICTTTGCDWS